MTLDEPTPAAPRVVTYTGAHSQYDAFRAVATRLDLPMPTAAVRVNDDGSAEFADEQWPHAFWVGTDEWFFPNEVPAIPASGPDGRRLFRARYDGPIEALGSILPVQGGTGHLHIGELVALFLETRRVHDTLLREDRKAWIAEGRALNDPEWDASTKEHAWFHVLERDHGWHPHFAELVAHIAEAAGLVEVGYSIYSSALTERAEAWALLNRVYEAALAGDAFEEDFQRLLNGNFTPAGG